MYNNGKQKQFLISRLVAKAFIPNPNKFPMVNHINLDRLDNRVSNLEWINNIGNINHAIENGVQMGKPKKVYQYHIDGNYITEYRSVKDASLQTGIGKTNISRACREWKNAGGYAWYYAEENIEEFIDDSSEEWRVLSDFPRYSVSWKGQIRNDKSYKILHPSPTKQGYIGLKIANKDNKQCKIKMHRLIAQTFIPNPNNYPVVNHLDENKSNNCVDNLEWVTRSRNSQYSYDTGKNTRQRCIHQYDSDGNFIKEYKSIVSAAKDNNISRESIYNSLKGQRSRKFIWRYAK